MTTATRPAPKHGERACYLRGCRRPECGNAHYRYMSRIRLEYQRGQRRRTDAQNITEHLNLLIAAGWTPAQIARAAGVGHRTLSQPIAGTRPTVSNTTARKLLTLPIGPPPADHVDTDATGSTRRVQALAAIGHTYPVIAAAVGIHKDALGVIARGERRLVRVATAQAVAAAYKKLSRTPGTSARTRMHAARLGWHGPLSWDNTTIDNPQATPETDTGTDELPRNELAAVRRAEAAHLAQFGVPAHEIAERLDMALSTVRTIIVELRTGQRRDRDKAAA